MPKPQVSVALPSSSDMDRPLKNFVGMKQGHVDCMHALVQGCVFDNQLMPDVF